LRLSELINFDPIDTKRTVNKYERDITDKTNSKKIGTGNFSTVHNIDSPKRQDQVTKIGKGAYYSGNVKYPATDVMNDGYLAYLKAIQNVNNPYFPKIHDLKVLRDKKGNIFYRTNIERLKPLTPKMLQNLKTDLFYETDIDVKELLRKIYQPGVFTLIKDEKLKDAISLIKDTAAISHHVIDTHSKNWMMRSDGQIIITDPIA
jgi:hypothetical protein